MSKEDSFWNTNKVSFPDAPSILSFPEIGSNVSSSDVPSRVSSNALPKITSVFVKFSAEFDKMEVSAEDISKYAEEVGIPPEEVEISVLENMDILGKAMAAITIVVSIVDAFLNVYNIVETVKRYNENIKIFNDARQQYKDYYKHLYDASVKYNPKSA